MSRFSKPQPSQLAKPRRQGLNAWARALAGATSDDRALRGMQEPESFIYKTPDGEPLRLFVRRPETATAGPHPAIVLFHGGAWRSGSAAKVDFLAREFAAQGLVAVAVEYRLLSENERLRVPHEAIQDARSAMRHLRAHAAEFDIDPDRIAAGGPSAGGHLAMMTALMSSRADGFDDVEDDLAVSPKAQALLLMSAVYTAAGHHRAQGIAQEDLEPVTPQRLVDAHNLPPTLILHGMADPATPYASAEAFVDAARAANAAADVQLLGFPGHGHNFVLPRMEGSDAVKARAAMHAFFVRLGWVRGPLPAAPWVSKSGPRWGRDATEGEAADWADREWSAGA